MPDQIERDLAALLRQRADETPDIPVPDALLRRTARPPRRPHRVLLTVSAAAAAVAVVVGGTTVATDVLTGDDRPAARGAGPGDPGPSYDASDAPRSDGGAVAPSPIPYIADGRLHVGRLTVATEADQVDWASDTVVVTDVYSEGFREAARSWVLRGDRLVRLPYLDDAVVRVSPDGQQVVALSHPSADVTRLTAYDLATGGQRDLVDLSLPGTCCGSGPVQLIGFDPAGRLFIAKPDQATYVWTPGASDPVAVTGAPGQVVQIAPQGALAVDGDDETGRTRVLGVVDDLGRFTPRRSYTMPETSATPIWSVSGQNVAWSGDEGIVFEPVDWDAGPIDTAIDLEGGTLHSLVGFESELDLLLVAGRDGRYLLLRCNVGGGPCEQLQDLGDRDTFDAAFPVRR